MGYFTNVDDYLAGHEKKAGLFDFLAKPFTGAFGAVRGVGKAVEEGPDLLRGIGGFIKDNPMTAVGIGAGIPGAYGLHQLVRNKLRAKDQDEVFKLVHKDDQILRDADRTELESAFDTFRAFAPTLATDPNATRSFLREAVTSGGGVNYNTINLLARTEAAIQGDSSHGD